MDIFTYSHLQELIRADEPPCVSIYLPTHRTGSDQDRIRWKNLLGDAEERLKANGLRAPDARAFLVKGKDLLEDALFWRNQSDGLVGFFSPDGGFRYFRLPVSFEETVIVGTRFHIKPLLPILNGDGRFFLLAMSQNQIRVLQGSSHLVEELNIEGLPASLADALRFDDKEEPLNYHTRPTSGGGWAAVFHGHGVGIDDEKDDLLRYFQMIDKGLRDLLTNEKSPLVLASVEYLQPIYRQANTYPHLLPEGIHGSPDRLSNKQLHSQAWPLVEPLFHHVREQASARYQQLAGTGQTTNDIEAVLKAAYGGQVGTLFVTSNHISWGTFDPTTTKVDLQEDAGLGNEDTTNLAAIYTLLHGGAVFGVVNGDMPDKNSFVAGIYRNPMASATT
jgi:hypothetical protein